jgi:hypothetical protein
MENIARQMGAALECMVSPLEGSLEIAAQCSELFEMWALHQKDRWLIDP